MSHVTRACVCGRTCVRALLLLLLLLLLSAASLHMYLDPPTGLTMARQCRQPRHGLSCPVLLLLLLLLPFLLLLFLFAENTTYHPSRISRVVPAPDKSYSRPRPDLVLQYLPALFPTYSIPSGRNYLYLLT